MTTGAGDRAGANAAVTEPTGTPRGWRRGYTEADIAGLESEDLIDSDVVRALDTAYREHDPEEQAIFPGFRRDPGMFRCGTQAQLERWIAEAEEALKTNPTDYMTRAKRLHAMVGREWQRRPEALRKRYPEIWESGLGRIEGDETHEPPGMTPDTGRLTVRSIYP